MVVAFPPDPANPTDGLTQDELIPLMEAQQFLKEETGYQRIQGTKPQTLVYGLNDSPAGLAAWIVEKFRTWSDCDGDVERRFSKDELLTNVMLYWVPETANSSCRLYCETMRAGEVPARRASASRCRPAARSSRARSSRPPRAWVEKLYNVPRWTRFPPAATSPRWRSPQRWSRTSAAFFRPLR